MRPFGFLLQLDGEYQIPQDPTGFTAFIFMPNRTPEVEDTERATDFFNLIDDAC